MECSGLIFGVRPIDAKLFFNVSDDDLLRQVHDEFPQELDRLKRAYSIGEMDSVHPPTPSPSQIIYGAQYNEVNRTLVSVLSLRWIYHNYYEIFTGTQPDQIKLTRSTFDWIRQTFMNKLEDPADLYALLAYIVINDLGKDACLVSDYYSKTGEDVSTLNHDIIMLKAVETGLVPLIDRLPRRHKDMIMRGIRLGAGFNPGQLAQAENAPASLSSLLQMQGHDDDFQFHFMQQLLDIAGAAGHDDWTCARKLIQPIAQAYRNVYEVAVGVILGNRSLRDAYDVILTRRGESLHKEGFKSLNVQHPEDRALLRLLCMGGVADLEMAELYLSVWEALDDGAHASLVRTLNIDGSFVEPAVQPTYMPAMLAQGIGKTGSASRHDKEQRLYHMLRYLSRVMVLEEEQHSHAEVIERSVLWVVKDVVQSRAFQKDPAILERTEVPKSAVAIPI
ncbi:hypothetical protein FPOAC2_04078 [Fusarium poae]|jgi:hypothetical protein|uniref:hypothetical protein n=1 Tax=Fusarium poae TaxID=36050 RepID=UPI001CE9AFE1|nr:hypothetical protein FPOAC1_004013 [Fusarium poae]KAG8670779.1 hypothetical protein FPOAC1_004013 [Fusarium poae]